VVWEDWADNFKGGKNLENQKKLLFDGVDWDCLIILDACRFDVIQKIYKDYLSDCLLEKVWSPGYNTPSWLGEIWTSFYEDLAYLSANPFVNSKGIEKGGFDGTKHFEKILDVWDWGGDDSWGVALPERVAKEARLARAQYPGKRLVVHFLQPHQPYLVELENTRREKGHFSEALLKMFQKTEYKIAKLGGGAVGKLSYKINQILIDLGVVNNRAVETFASVHGENKLRYAYRENVKRTLKSSAKLVDRLPGKVVITSDHGEFLGEEGSYGHSYFTEDPVQRVVPWIVIDS